MHCGEVAMHYGLSPIEKGDIKNFKFKALLHIQLWSKNVQTFFKWCQTPKSWLLILVFIIYVKYLQSYLQKTWRGGLTNLKFCVLANQLVPKKRVENNIFVRGPPFMGQISDKYFLHHFHLKICPEIFAVTFKRYIQLVLNSNSKDD